MMVWTCFLVILHVGASVVWGQQDNDGVPVRSAPVYPDGFSGSDSATSHVSNGRISAHLEYVDRGSTGRRGDITRARPTNTDTSSAGGTRTYGSSTSDTSSQTGQPRRVSGGGRRTNERTPVARQPSGSGRRIPTYAGTPDEDAGSTSYGSVPTSHGARTVPVYGSSPGIDTSGQTYGVSRERPRLATGRRFGTGGRSTVPFDITPQTGGRYYNPLLPRRTTYTNPQVDSRTPDRGTQTGSFNQQCPSDNFRILIDGIDCHIAISTLGTHVCYDDRVLRDRRCCERCLQLRNYQKPGCEYGDRSSRCSALLPSQCYIRSNRNICCQTCERLRDQTKPGCEYGDLSPTCAQLPRRLCSNIENQRICCQTCERMRDPLRPECPFGDRSSQCGVISGGACYNPRVKDTCCATCQRLDVGIPGCQFGDHNAIWTSPAGDLDCETYVRIYGVGSCADANFSTRCCRSCRSWAQGTTQ